MNLAGAQKLHESFFLVGKDAWFHQDNEADLTSFIPKFTAAQQHVSPPANS